MHKGAVQNAQMEPPHNRLQTARERAGFESATAAAEALGIAPPTYLAHENGSRGFKARSAARYAKFFKISLEWLLTGRGSDADDSLDARVDALDPEDQRLIREQIAFLEARGRLKRTGT